MVCKGKQRIIGVIWNSCRVRGQKSKVSYRYAELGTVKVKKKLGMFRSSHCSLYLLVLRKEKELIPFLYFSLQHYLSLNSFFFFFILGFSLFQMLEYNDQHTPKNNQGHKEGRRHEQHRTRTSDAGIT